jgi:hypothetical protein
MARRPAVTAALAWLLWIPSCMALACCLFWLAGASRAGGRVAVVLGALSLPLPLVIRDAPVLRAGIALYLLWSWFKLIDIVRDPVPRSAGFRALQALVVHDLRRDGFVRTGPRRELRLGLVASALGAGAIALLALHAALFGATALPGPERLAVRYGAGLVFAYLGVEAMLRFFEFSYRSLGLKPPVMHDHPILSRSLAEFWGRRWNRVVGGWLFSTFYRPLAARGRRALGTLAAFLASALLHLYFTWAAVGIRWGLWMAAFFVLQVPLLWLEERIHQRAWPGPLRRAWTVGWMGITSPLFIEPLLAIMQGGFTP